MIANSLKVIYTIFKSVSLISIIEEVFMERLLTTEEVAELLRIDPVTVTADRPGDGQAPGHARRIDRISHCW